MASTIKGFLPLGWDDVPDGQAIVKSATGVVGGTLSSPLSIRVSYGTTGTSPTKVAGDTSLGVATFPGDGQFRITHGQGDINFAVQVTRVNSRFDSEGSLPSLSSTNVSVPHVEITSTYVDVWFVHLDGFQVTDMEFFLTIFPY